MAEILSTPNLRSQVGFGATDEEGLGCDGRGTPYRRSMSTPFADELLAARRAANMSKAQLSRELGVSATAIGFWEAGSNRPELPKFLKLAQILRLDLERPAFREYMAESNMLPLEDNEQRFEEMAANTYAAITVPRARFTGFTPDMDPRRGVDARTFGGGGDVYVAEAKSLPSYNQLQGLARDVPVKGIAVAGEDGDFLFNGETADWVTRPPGLANSKDIFALHVVSDSMYPAWREGSVIYVTPHRPPTSGEDCIIELLPTEEGSPGPAYFKRYKGRSGSRIIVEQFNPPKDLEFDVRAVRLYRVIPWEEALGLTS